MSSGRSAIAKVLDAVKKAAESLPELSVDRVLSSDAGQQIRVRLRFDFSVGRTDVADFRDRLLLVVSASSGDVSEWLSGLGLSMEGGDFAGAYFSQYSAVDTDVSALERATSIDLRALVQDAWDFVLKLSDSVRTPLELLQLIERNRTWRPEFFRMTAFRALVVDVSYAVEVASAEIERLRSVKFGQPRNLSELEAFVARIRSHGAGLRP